MRIDLKSYGSEQELYVDGILVLAGEEMGAHEALEAISDVSKDVELLAIDPGAGAPCSPSMTASW